MFKIICNLHKIKQNGFTYLSYKNCQPCYFSDYQLFDTKLTTQERIEQAQLITDTFNQLSLDINKSEYKELYKKIYHIDDLSEYNYITIFDEAKMPQLSSQLEATWLYSTIVRHIDTADTSYYIFDFLSRTYDSWFNSKKQAQITQTVHAENFRVIWEKYYLFEVHQDALTNYQKGIIAKDNVDQYSINTLFLSYLLQGAQNTQCTSLISANTDITNQAQEDVYSGYILALPRLVGLQYLQDQLSKTSHCIMPYKEDSFYIYNEREQFTIKSPQVRLESIEQCVSMADVCKHWGGKLQAVSSSFAENQNKCLSSSEIIKSTLTFLDDDLYPLNCDTIGDILAALPDINELYPC